VRRWHLFTVLSLAVAPLSASAQQQATRDSLDEPCSVSDDPRWTDQEKFVWGHICVGEDANFNDTALDYGGDLDPKKPAGWPQNRVLRPAFLETVLLKNPYQSALKRRGVVISGAHFTETIDLEGAELKHSLVLSRSLFDNGVSLKRARSEHHIDFSGSKIAGTLNMNGLDLKAPLFMDKAELAEIDLVSANVGGPLDLTGARVTSSLDMNGLRLDKHLFMREGAEFAKIDLVSAVVGGTLDLRGSKVTGTFDMIGLRVGEALIGDEAEFAEANLVFAHIGRLSLHGAKVARMLDMRSLQVDGGLGMDDAEFAEVILIGARIGGPLYLSGSKVAGPPNADAPPSAGYAGITGENVALDLSGAHVGGTVEIDHAKLSGNLLCENLVIGQDFVMNDGSVFDGYVRCYGAKIGGRLDLSDGEFRKQLNFSEAEVGGELFLDSAKWPSDAMLTLKNTKIGGIPALSADWPKKLQIDGLSYHAVRGADEFELWFGKADRYAPQPYDQLAAVVRSEGNKALATKILYSGRERERKDAAGWNWVWLTVLKPVIGYGYYPERSVLWVLGLLTLGIVVLRVSGEGPRNRMPFGIVYSFDMLLPIIQLRKRHYDIDLRGWARYYFYGHKIMGYLLATFLIAGLSGLTK
jgi:hypothetical protein